MPSVRIRDADGHDKEDCPKRERSAARPKEPPGGTTVGFGIKSEKGERLLVFGSLLLSHLTRRKPKIEKSCDDRAATEKRGDKQKHERQAKDALVWRAKQELLILE